jgi:hypothetical protein
VSLLTQAIIAEMYGLRLTMDQLAETLSIAVNAIHGQFAKGIFDVPPYVEGKAGWLD